jgi:hypothetical protein
MRHGEEKNWNRLAALGRGLSCDEMKIDWPKLGEKRILAFRNANRQNAANSYRSANAF